MCIRDRQATALQLPAKDHSVDVLVNNYMFDLFSFAEMDAVLKEFRRVLKPGGRLVLVNMTIGEQPGSGLYDWIYVLSPKTMGGCRGVRLTPRLQKHRFEVAIREYHQQMLFPSEVILAYR